MAFVACSGNTTEYKGPVKNLFNNENMSRLYLYCRHLVQLKVRLLS